MSNVIDLLNKTITRRLDVSLNNRLSDLMESCTEIEENEIKIFLQCTIHERGPPRRSSEYSSRCISLVICILALIQDFFS